MTVLQESAREVVRDIYKHDYYISLFERVLSRHNGSRQAIEKCALSDSKLVAIMNDFWFVLPDGPQIRRHPFFAICDIAEHIFDDEKVEA